MTADGHPPERHPDDEEALDWALRTGDPRFDAWDALASWLEADPARAARYDRAAMDLADMTAALRAAPVPLAPAPHRDAYPRPAVRRWLMAGTVAAAAAGVVGYHQFTSRAQPYAIATAAGEMRGVTLPDGSRVVLAGTSRLVLDRVDPRVATLDRGEALFTVRHDAAHPFQVTAANERLTDLGTVFDVAVTGGGLTVAVAEGGVRVGDGRDALDLGPGDRARIGQGGAMRTVSRVRPDTVGAWTTGQLSYAGAPLGEVVGVLAQALGTQIVVVPAMAARPFSGTLSLDALRRDPAALGPLAGGVMVRRADGWELRAD